jgi:methanethiol S-methyltransferase
MKPNKNFVLVYGVFCYVLHWGITFYLIGFMGNLCVPKSVDVASQPCSTLFAIVADLLLVSLFIGQHWLMARPWFKSVWTRWVAKPIERSTYVLMTCGVLIVMFWLWQPIGNGVWLASNDISRQFLLGVYLAGWTLAIVATFPINHWDLFGIRQAWLYWRGVEYTPPTARSSTLYRILPHPIFVGYGIAAWAAPYMGWAHFLLSSALTLFLLIDVRLAGDEG